MDVREFVLNQLQKEYTIDSEIDIDKLNYVENGYVDSLGVIQFVIEIEEEFKIEFSDEEISDSSFQIVGGLINLIERKVKKNEKS